MRVLAPLLAFCASSLAAAAVDTVALLVLHAATGTLLGSVIGARLLSAGVNFAINRNLVFPGRSTTGPRVGRSAARYAALATTLLAVNYLLLAALTGLGVALLPAKIATETALSLLSFQVQRRFVFADPAGRVDPARTAPRARERRTVGR
ncbi:GtrA family protein [Cellulomonas triticagri]|uniref:GtrA family protein n=1 Tax=Cellulomonas triticagri TaxID=2483352 RepID=UPI001F31E432|nr:GtrA family protein [Cellulomonas triticagri]